MCSMSLPTQRTLMSARKFILGIGLSNQCHVCAACRKDITKCIRDDKYQPRWAARETAKCTIAGCTERSSCHTHRQCPNPAKISAYLRQSTEYEVPIKPIDRVCYVCYKAHLEILQQHKNKSTDEDLIQLLDHLQTYTTLG